MNKELEDKVASFKKKKIKAHVLFSSTVTAIKAGDVSQEESMSISMAILEQFEKRLERLEKKPKK